MIVFILRGPSLPLLPFQLETAVGASQAAGVRGSGWSREVTGWGRGRGGGARLGPERAQTGEGKGREGDGAGGGRKEAGGEGEAEGWDGAIAAKLASSGVAVTPAAGQTPRRPIRSEVIFLVFVSNTSKYFDFFFRLFFA